MKKYLFSILLVLFLFILCFDADALEARAPGKNGGNVPKTDLFADVDESFDFSKISFSSTTSNNIVGYSEMKKIILSEGYNPNGEKPTLDENWFTAYCLDGELKYPSNGFATVGWDNTTSDRLKFENALFMVYRNSFSNENLYNHFYNLRNYNYANMTYVYNGETATVNVGTPSIDYSALVNTLKSGGKVTVTISNVQYLRLSDFDAKNISGSELSNLVGKTGDFELEVNIPNSLFHLYSFVEMPHSINYNHALWILEHTYPTLSLDSALSMANVNINNLKSELKTLDSNINDSNIDEYLENYVYSTIQYAIWKVYDGKHGSDGASLGDTLIGSNELNKLYQYLIKDRAIYVNYDKNDIYTSKLEIVEPKDGKILYKDTGDEFIYGPFSIKDTLISIGDATIKIGNTDKKNTKIINKDGNEISNIKLGEEFYIKALKKDNMTTINVDVKYTDAISFVPVDGNVNANRGRIYYAYSPFVQNVVIGGKIDKVSGEANLKIETQPKEGVEDVGILLLVTLGAFLAGYVVLNYKGKSLGQLN